MVLRQLEYLVALAREKHFGRAALACNVSQPTLSAAIRQLEDELGAPIVERGHKFHGLTAQGRMAVEHAQRIFAEADAMRASLRAMDKGLSGRLRLGAVPTALPFVSQLTGPFHARYPSVRVTVLSQTSQEIQRGIDDFALDAGLTYLDAEPLEHVLVKPVYQEEYVFLTAASGPYGQRRKISWKEAARAPLVPSHPRHAEPADHRRHIPLGRGPADAFGRDQFDLQPLFACELRALVLDRAAPAPAVLRRSAPHPRARTRRTDRAPDHRPHHVRSRPASPIARNLFAMAIPADLGSLIVPPVALPEPDPVHGR